MGALAEEIDEILKETDDNDSVIEVEPDIECKDIIEEPIEDNEPTRALTEDDYNTMKQYVDLLHSDSKKFIVLANSNSKAFKPKGLKYKDIQSGEYLKEYQNDAIVSLNTFSEEFYYRKEHLQELKALSINLNTYNTEKYKNKNKEVIEELKTKYFGCRIPPTSFIISTGRGLRLDILLNRTSQNELEIWNKVQRYLLKTLKHFGAEKKYIEYTELIRIPGSINRANGKVVEILDQTNIKYDLDTIYNQYVLKSNPLYDMFSEFILAEMNKHSPTINPTHTPNPSLTRREVEKLPESQYSDPESYLKLLFGENYNGYVHIWSKDGVWNDETYYDKKKEVYKVSKMHFYKSDAIFKIPKKAYNTSNLFIAINNFKRKRRKTANVSRINAIILDLDLYKTRFNKQEAIEKLKNEYFDKSMPAPSLIIDSGGGLYLLLLLDQMTEKQLPFSKAKQYWTLLESHFIELLSEFNADTNVKDLPRVLRIAGSLNGKYENLPQVKILEHTGYKYSLNNLINQYLPQCVDNSLSKDMIILTLNELMKEVELKSPELYGKLLGLAKSNSTIPFKETREYQELYCLLSGKPMEEIAIETTREHLDIYTDEEFTEEEEDEEIKIKREVRPSITAIGKPIYTLMPFKLVEKIDKGGRKYKVQIYNIVKNKKKKLKEDISTQLLCGQQVHDIELLCRKRNYAVEGYRHWIITYHLHYSLYWLNDTEQALQLTRELYNKIKEGKAEQPYTEEEFTEATSLVINNYLDNGIPVEMYSSNEIIRMLNITDEETMETDKLWYMAEEDIENMPKVELDVKSEYYIDHMIRLITRTERKLREERSSSRYYIRRKEKDTAAGKPTRENNKKEMDERLLRILKLLNEGMTSRQIIETLKRENYSISESTLKRDKRELKKQGLWL